MRSPRDCAFASCVCWDKFSWRGYRPPSLRFIDRTTRWNCEQVSSPCWATSTNVHLLGHFSWPLFALPRPYDKNFAKLECHFLGIHHLSLRYPETFFISRETHFFFLSVFRVVQVRPKHPKNGVLQGAFLHVLKIGTFCGKWTLERLFKTSHLVRLALYFF